MPRNLLFLVCTILLSISVVSGCRTWHYTDTRLDGFDAEAGASLDPDEFIDGLRPGISLRAIPYYEDGTQFSIPVNGEWTIKFSRPYQRFVVVAAAPQGFETLAVFWGLTADADTPMEAYPCSPGQLCKYQFTVLNNHSGDVQLTVRALYGVRLANHHELIRDEAVAVYTLHFSTSLLDGFAKPG